MPSHTNKLHTGCLTVNALLFTLSFSFAQEGAPSRWQAQFELGGWGATSPAQPFWLRTDQYGTVPLSTPAATVRAGLWKPYAHERPSESPSNRSVESGRSRSVRPDNADTVINAPKKWDWRFGVSSVANAATRNQMLLPEAYLELKYKSIELSVGRWHQLTGLGDSTLSSGFIMGSGNALPIPKVQLATMGFVPLKFLKSWVAIHAGFGHGWFNVPYVQGSYLHQKYVYARLGKPAGKINVYAGINHEVQWGGQADYLIGTPYAINGKLPSRVKYYADVVFGLRPKDWQNSDYTSFDGAYWIGNSLGSSDLAIELATRRGSWLVYHQHIYEDLSGLLWVNFPDGLTGLSWHRTSTQSNSASCQLQRFVVEFLTTMNQSGATFNIPNSVYQGNDNYFNHGQYREGWSYLGRTLGTPFIIPQSDVQSAAKGTAFFPNNRVNMGYIGAQGLLFNTITWTWRTSYSRNYGTFAAPYPVALGQLSSWISTQVPLSRWPGTTLTASLALDQGNLLPSSAGGFVSLKKRY